MTTRCLRAERDRCRPRPLIEAYRGIDLGPPCHPALPLEPERVEQLRQLLRRLETTLAGL